MARSSDRRVWARLTVDFADSPKVAGLSDAAFRALVEMILWSRKMMTDGVIPASVARRRWGAKTQAETHSVTDSVTDSGTHCETDPVTELCTNHPTSPSLSRSCDGDYVIHDFLDHQESAEEVNARNARNAANGRRGGRPRKTDSKTHSVTDSVTDSGTQTEPKPKAELELELEEVLRTSSGGSGGKRNDVATPVGTEVAPEALPAPKMVKRSDRATRLPDDWAPSPALIDWTRANAPDVQDGEVDRFRDYWHSAAGAKARKVNWDAVWRNWARRAQEDADNRRSRQGYRNQAQIMADMRQQAAESTITMQRASQGDALRLIAGGAS